MTELSTIEIGVDTASGALSPKDTIELRKRLLRLGVARVEFGTVGDVPQGAKAGEILSLATITLTLIPVVYPDVVKALKEWAGLSRDRRVKIRRRNAEKEVEIEYNLDDVDTEQVAELMGMLGKEVE